MRTKCAVAIAFVSCFFAALLSGCGNEFFDPTQVGRFRPTPAVNVILDSLGVADEVPSEWGGAEDPKPVDTMVLNADHIFAPGDFVRVSVFELLAEGTSYMNDFIVTETGNISIPEIGIVQAEGLTESQLEDQIRQALTPGILKDPSVTVILLSSQQRTYSINGNAVTTPGRNFIPRYDFRLNDALAVAGVKTQFNVSYVYVSRRITGEEPIEAPAEPKPQRLEPQPEKLIEPEQEMLEIIAPSAHQSWRRPKYELVITSAEMASDEELIDAALPQGFEPLKNGTDRPSRPDQPEQPSSPRTIDQPIDQGEAARIEWIFKDGRWVPVQVGEPAPEKPPVAAEKPLKRPLPSGQPMPEEISWEQLGQAGVQNRLIKIPTDKLAAGDPRYNIVIRPGDNINVPVDLIGEFWVQGNVNFRGPVPITGRPLTLKMAIAAAGGLGPLAWPKRCEVVRRIGKNREEIVMVDLDKISKGEQPDFFIKPNDLINVGTHPTARWRAVLRNAFRATYGFGFVYDRNFADRDFGTSRPLPDWF